MKALEGEAGVTYFPAYIAPKKRARRGLVSLKSLSHSDSGEDTSTGV